MNVEEFHAITRLLKKRSGVLFGADKAFLLESRLGPVLRKWQLKGLDDLTAILRHSDNQDLVMDVTEAMLATDTSFFRDLVPFYQIRETVLPVLAQKTQNGERVRLWSAGCSSGQEAYSLAMTIWEARKHIDLSKVEILGTDLSTAMIRKATLGAYSQVEVQRGLPVRSMLKHFTKKQDKWHVVDELRRLVKFEVKNLVEPFDSDDEFDVILCRNVISYFDADARGSTLRGFAGALKQGDGTLVLGVGENANDLPMLFHPMNGHYGLYQRKEDVHYREAAS